MATTLERDTFLKVTALYHMAKQHQDKADEYRKELNTVLGLEPDDCGFVSDAIYGDRMYPLWTCRADSRYDSLQLTLASEALPWLRQGAQRAALCIGAWCLRGHGAIPVSSLIGRRSNLCGPPLLALARFFICNGLTRASP